MMFQGSCGMIQLPNQDIETCLDVEAKQTRFISSPLPGAKAEAVSDNASPERSPLMLAPGQDSLTLGICLGLA